MNRSAKMRGISRIDQPSHRTHGFFVRLHHLGKIHSGFFADQMYGGRKPALAAAQVYYLKLRSHLGLPRRVTRRWNAEIVRHQGRSGICGVRRYMFRGQSGRLLKYWLATWSPELGVVRRKQFSIRKYGEEKAKQLAIRARRAGLRSMK